MSSDVLREIEDSIRYGDKVHARELLEQVLRDQPSAQAWYLAAQAVDDTDGMITALKNALKLDPDHEVARRALDALQSLPPDAGDGTAAQTSTPPSPVMPPEPAPKVEARPTPTRPPRKEGGANVYDDGVYEMLWNCRYCGTEKLLGKTHRFCPNCGATQDPEWRYYPSDEEKVAVKDHVFVGADHTCPSCGTLQAANVKFCTRCGAPQDAAEAVKTQAARVGNAFTGEDLHTRQQVEFDQLTGRDSLASRSTKAKPRSPLMGIIIAVIVIAVIGGILYAIFASREAVVYAAGFQWERVVYVEELKSVPGRSVCSSMPAGAYSVDRRREQVDTRRVPDGESCTNRQVDNGDGTFRQERVCQTTYRDEPVYGDVCYYTIDLWQPDRESRISGDKSTEVVWPDPRLAPTGNCRGCERESGREELYVLVLRDGDKTYECPVTPELWQATNIEDTFNLQVAQVGGAPRCNTLERAG
jgi:hypothetical protein